MRSLIVITGIALLFFTAAAAGQGSKKAESSGELLYSTYCIGCHTTQMHWREKSLAKDWTSLKFQIRRWQANGGLSFSEDDVNAVAKYLNVLYYQFPVTDTKLSG